MGAGWNKRDFTKADHRGQEDARKDDGGLVKDGDQIDSERSRDQEGPRIDQQQLKSLRGEVDN